MKQASSLGEAADYSGVSICVPSTAITHSTDPRSLP